MRSGSEYPWRPLRTWPSASAAARAAVAPAAGPARRAATRNASTTPSSPVARTISAHAPGAASPSGESGAMTSAGSGLKEGPPVVDRSRCASSRPQTSHA